MKRLALLSFAIATLLGLFTTAHMLVGAPATQTYDQIINGGRK
jgi:hypothetical protein